MTRALALLSIALPVFAQDAKVASGEKLFQTRCSVPYCHGPNGTAGRAPKLAGHGFTTRDVFEIVANGTEKGMPAFASQLQADDINAVVSYVMSLQGAASDGVRPAASKTSVPAEAQAGKALFFDAVRMGGCGRCHELEKRGSRVAPDLTAKSPRADFRSITIQHVVTVEPSGEPAFPAVVVERSEKRIRVFDLSSPLPVLRTFAPASATVKDGSAWNHRDAVSGYADEELQQIAAYLDRLLPAK